MIAHRYRFVRDPYERFVSLYLLARRRATSPGVSSSTTSSRKALLDRLEELEDIEDLKKIRHQPTRPLADLLRELRLDGGL